MERFIVSDHLMYDVVILGSGPAGLQAAVHAARKKAKVLVLGRIHKSSLWWAHVENFCCVFSVTGEEMLRIGREQAENFGADTLEEDVLDASPDENGQFVVQSESGQTFKCKSLIIATGTTRNKLGAEGEKKLLGKGVSYCIDCDANFYRGEDIAVVGGESAAVSGAIHMDGIANSVHLVCEKINVAEELVQQLDESKVKVIEEATVKAIRGEDKVEGLELADGRVLDVTGVFIELGAKGVLELTSTLGVMLDESMKYIEADKKQRTNVPGIFAAGDICGPPLQMAKAVGEGCVAGIEAAKFAKRGAEAAAAAET
jgi:thioredoxin reductase (NADPH)